MKFLIKLFLLFVTCFTLQAQEFPEPLVPKRLVNDFTSLFTAEEQAQLERMLLSYYDTTSTEIAVVTVPTLHGYEINDYGTRLFNKWGVGGAKGNNGVLILIKPKSAEERNGQVFIVTGYGMEGVLPDAAVNRIVDNEMVPRFQKGQNFEAVTAAATVIFQLAKGSFTADQYLKRTGGAKKKNNLIPIIIIAAIVLIFSGLGRRGGGKNLSSRGDIPLWILLSLLNSGGGGRGSFGGFSSGGGGFGGFGGGRSGGGGAGGSW